MGQRWLLILTWGILLSLPPSQVKASCLSEHEAEPLSSEELLTSLTLGRSSNPENFFGAEAIRASFSFIDAGQDGFRTAATRREREARDDWLAPGSLRWPAQEAPSLKDFPRQFLRNLGGLFSKDNLKPFLIAVVAAGSASALDDPIKDHFIDQHRFESAGRLGQAMGHHFVVAGVTGGLLVSSYLAQDQRFQSMVFTFTQGYALNLALNGALKSATGRLRPNGESHASFPSGHASTAFTWATVLHHYYGSRAAIPAYLTAAFIGASRLEMNKHYLSDVVAGAALGYIIGRTVIRGTETMERKHRVQWAPLVSPGAMGLAAAVNF